MKLGILSLVIWLCASPILLSQTNILVTNPAADAVLKGNYNPVSYAASLPVADPLDIADALSARISPDSLKNIITRLSAFGTRNTGSDTLSDHRGVGAARRWIYEQLKSYSASAEDRLLVSYLQFDQNICTVGQHRNIFAVLPGSDTTAHGVIVVEGHMDSRCDTPCDTACLAEGVEDNASGTVLVMELARVMSAYTFPNTIVFLVTIGEEQGLFGANAFAEYCETEKIPVRAVYNNDIVGGILCGKTSSPPSCPGLNDVDSISVRLFSNGSFNSPHKQLARFAKLEYNEILKPTALVPMDVRIMSPEDRTGRGGDHIPFRQRGYPAIRFCSANEHGDASNGTGYTDRQHTERDILGIDTDGDNVVDSFFVDFNYLTRNALINANAITMAAQALPTPLDFTVKRNGAAFTITVNDQPPPYRVFLRTSASNDFEGIFDLPDSTSGTFPCGATGLIFVSVATVGTDGVESLFSIEKSASPAVGVEEPGFPQPIKLLQNRPNPFDEATWIVFEAETVPAFSKASILIHDLKGQFVAEMPVGAIKPGINELLYQHGYGHSGSYAYSLVIDGRIVDSKQMVFAN